MTKNQVHVPALVALAVFVVGGLVALYLGHETAGAALIGAALGQLGPQPMRLGVRK